MFYSLITPTFTLAASPLLCCCCCWSHSPTAPRRANGIEVILCSGSPGPNLKSLVCQFSQVAVIFPTSALNGIRRADRVGAVCSLINGSKERNTFVFEIKIHETFVIFSRHRALISPHERQVGRLDWIFR